MAESGEHHELDHLLATSSTSERSELLPLKGNGSFPDADDQKRPLGIDKEPITDWRAINICAVVYFFITTILTALNVVAYLYLKSIDSATTPVYSGLHTASTKVGHALGTIAFAVYAHRTKSFRKPLLIGRALSVLSMLLYLGILLFPKYSRRVVFLVAFLGQSMAMGSLIVIRAFVPRVSSRSDRGAAYGIISGAMMMSILAGPGIQLVAGLLPPVRIFSWLHLNAFTYTIWMALALTLIASALIQWAIEEPKPIEANEEEEEGGGSLITMLTTALAQLKGMDKVALSFVFFEKTIVSACFATMSSAFVTFVETILNKSKAVALLYVAVSQAVVGLIAILTIAVFVFTPLGKARSSPVLFFALACYFLLYLWSYPWPTISEPFVVWNNATEPHGCDVAELPWCAWQWHVRLWYWLPVLCPLFAMAVPTSQMSLDTVYSTLLGNIDQNLMQGALVLVEDLASSVAPVLSMEIYTAHGPALCWLIMAGTAAVGFIAWLPMIPKMRRLKM